MKKNYIVVVIAVLLLGCGSNLVGNGDFIDGYYTAEMTDFDSHGWKEFLSIHINNGRIDTVEYNAKNASGFIKSWDPEYMRLMNAVDGTYPNEYTRTYARALLVFQDTRNIDVLTGATNSYHTFILLANTALEQARAGSKQVAFVSNPSEEP